MSYRVEIEQSHDFGTNNYKHLLYIFDNICSYIVSVRIKRPY